MRGCQNLPFFQSEFIINTPHALFDTPKPAGPVIRRSRCQLRARMAKRHAVDTILKDGNENTDATPRCYKTTTSEKN